LTRKKRNILRLFAWIPGGFIALVLVITLSFYLGRTWIMEKVVDYLNENRPGEVHIAQMNLLPLMDFPNSVLQFKDFTLYENPVRADSLHQEPILYLHELNLSLNILELIRGNIKVDQFRMENGFVRLEVYADSLMNLEKALGSLMAESPSPQDEEPDSTRSIDVDKIELINILALYKDHNSGDQLNIQINQLESQFSYLPGLIESGIELNVDINNINYQNINVEDKHDIVFSSHILYDSENRNVQIEPSFLTIAGLELETWGSYDFLNDPQINMAFRASNTGLDVLNFLFLGILDLDEIEQIGAGSIHLDGSVSGSLGEKLPVVRVNGYASGIGFRVKALDRDVEDISFTLYATNGGEADFSEGLVELKDFKASFPEGMVHGDIKAKNLIRPDIDLVLKGDLSLAGLEQMIEMEKLKSLGGKVSFDAMLSGIIDRETDMFLDEARLVTLTMDQVGFVLDEDTIKQVDGTLYMDGNVLGARNLGMVYNGSEMNLEVRVENILEYILDYDKDVNLELKLGSERILPGRLTGDTLLTGLLGEELKGLHFKAEASITRSELDAFLEQDTIPEFNFTLDSFGIELPFYADISDLSASLNFDTDTLSLHYLNGMIGESRFSFSGSLLNIEAYFNKDSGEMLAIDYRLASPRMRAEDLFRYKNGFLLPETYRTEYLEDFQLSGSAQFPVEAIIYDSVELDFGIEVKDMGWHFRYYPMAIDQFRAKIQKKGNEMIIEKLEGNIGDSNVKLNALIGNYADSTLESLYGYMVLESDLLDFNQLLNYQLPEEEKELADTSELRDPPHLDQMAFPDFTFNMDLGELRYGGNTLFGLRGTLRSSTERVLYMDHLLVSGKSGGFLGFNGQFNVSNPNFYILSTELEMKDVNIQDLNFQMQSGEQVYTLEENFAGIVSGTGLAEVFISPDFKLDMENTTALFQVEVKDGALINFKALEAAGKYLDNKAIFYFAE